MNTENKILRVADASKGAVLSFADNFFVHLIFKTYGVQYTPYNTGLFEFRLGQALISSREMVFLTEPSMSHKWDAKTRLHEYHLTFSDQSSSSHKILVGELIYKYSDIDSADDDVVWIDKGSKFGKFSNACTPLLNNFNPLDGLTAISMLFFLQR